MDKKLNSLALGYAGAIVSGIGMLALSILGKLGIYTGAVEMMQQWHMFFSLSIGGIIGGVIEAAAISFIFLYLFGLIYNKLSKS
jgi:hypothetical protein